MMFYCTAKVFISTNKNKAVQCIWRRERMMKRICIFLSYKFKTLQIYRQWLGLGDKSLQHNCINHERSSKEVTADKGIRHEDKTTEFLVIIMVSAVSDY